MSLPRLQARAYRKRSGGNSGLAESTSTKLNSKRYSELAEGKGGRVVNLTVEHLDTMGREEVRVWLESNDIQRPDRWKSLDLWPEEEPGASALAMFDRDNEEVLSMGSEMYSGSEDAKEKLRGMAFTLRPLGATEADLVAPVELNIELAGERMQASRAGQRDEQGRKILTQPTEIWDSRVELAKLPTILGSTKGGIVRVRAR